MPCSDSRDTPESVKHETLRKARHNSDVAELLCQLLQRLEYIDPENVLFDEIPGLEQWWQEHQRRDNLRTCFKEGVQWEFLGRLWEVAYTPYNLDLDPSLMQLHIGLREVDLTQKKAMRATRSVIAADLLNNGQRIK